MRERSSPSDVTPPAAAYLAELEEAVLFTRAIGCTRRRSFRAAAQVATGPFAEIIREWARVNICSRPDDRIAGRCLEITFALVEFLASAGVSSLYTLGWMSFGGNPVYHFTPDDVRTWLAHGHGDRQKIDMHAWVTLSSGEIIDPSWLSTVGIVRDRRELIGAVIIAEPAQPTSHRYHPVTIDTAILARIGLVQGPDHTFRAQQAPPPAVIAAAVTG